VEKRGGKREDSKKKGVREGFIPLGGSGGGKGGEKKGKGKKC